VLDTAQGLKTDAYPLDIMRQLVLHKPSTEVLNACPPLVAGTTGRTSDKLQRFLGYEVRWICENTRMTVLYEDCVCPLKGDPEPNPHDWH
jgi:hypothetical protein